MFAADYENELREIEPDRFATDEGKEYVRDYIPIVYVSVGAQATPKDLSIDLSISFAEFLMQPYRGNRHQDRDHQLCPQGHAHRGHRTSDHRRGALP